MTRETALGLATACVGRVMDLAPDSMTASTRLVEDLGVDSIAFIMLADALEARLAAEASSAFVTDEALLQLHTVGDVVELLVEIA